MKVFIHTCDKFDHFLPINAFLFNKFWDKEVQVTVLGYRKPMHRLPNNFEFVSMGEKNGPPHMWATDLKKYFNSIEDDYFILSPDDCLLVRPANFSILKLLKSFISDSVGRVDLTSNLQNQPHKIMEKNNSFNIVEQNQDAPYRVSFGTSIWNRKYLLNYLIEGYSPWQCEIEGTKTSKNDGYQILGTQGMHVIDYCNVHRKGNRGKRTPGLDFSYVNKSNVSLDNKTINELIDLNIIDKNHEIMNHNLIT